MQYYSKKYLYKFLHDKGYKVPDYQYMQYETYVDQAWLTAHLIIDNIKFGIFLISCAEEKRISIHITEYNKETKEYNRNILIVYYNEKLKSRDDFNKNVLFDEENNNWITYDYKTNEFITQRS